MNHSFNTDVAREVGMEAATILENIYFWCKKNEANNKLVNGKPFTYNSVKAFNEIFYYMSPSTISRVLKRLEESGFIESGCFNPNAYDRTKWYCITSKAREIYEPNRNENCISQNTGLQYAKSDDCICQNEKWINRNDKSNCQNEKSISQKVEMNITDINTDNNQDINTDNNSISEADEKKTKNKSKKSVSKTEQAEKYLSQFSERDYEVFKQCADTFLTFKRNINPNFATNKAGYTCWLQDFAQCSLECKTANEVLDTLHFALNDTYWKSFMFSPKNFVSNFEKIYHRRIMSKHENVQKPIRHIDLSDKYDLSDMAM